METIPFPVDVLKPMRGTAKPQACALNIQIPLEPFELPAIGEVQTTLSIEPTAIPKSTTALSGRAFSLPSNPDPGYVDASMYIEHRHHIVDLHEIAFGEAQGDMIPATIDCTILFSVEGLVAGEEAEYADTPWRFACWLDFELFSDPEKVAKQRWLRKLAKRISGI